MKMKLRSKKVFQELKEACAKKSVFKIFNSRKNIQMKIDASNLAIGACILQMDDEK